MFRGKDLCEGSDDLPVEAFGTAGGQNEALPIIVGKRAAQVRDRPKCRQHAARVEHRIKTPGQIAGNGFLAVDNLR